MSETCSRRLGSTSAAKHPKKSRSRLCPKLLRSCRAAAAVFCVNGGVIFTQPSPSQAEKPPSSSPHSRTHRNNSLIAAAQNRPGCPRRSHLQGKAAGELFGDAFG